MTSALPLVAVLPSRYVSGINDFSETPADYLSLVPFTEALETAWPTWAHAVQYVVAEGDDVQPFPRINKPCLPSLRQAGGEVWVTWFGVDLDTPEHQRLTEETYPAFEDSIVAAMDFDPILRNFTAYYTTRGGVRIIYVLKQPQQAESAEHAYRQLLQLFMKAGLKPDTSCIDWTRLFALPRGLREGQPLGVRSFDQLVIQEEARLDVNLLPKFELIDALKERSPYAPAISADIPSDIVYGELCQVVTNKGREVMSPWMKEAKRRLKNRHCYGCLFQDEALAQKGARTNTLQKLVGEACALLIRQPNTTPEHIYAMFWPVVMRLETDVGTPDWRVPLWKAVCTYWPREFEKQARIAQEQEILQQTKWNELIENMKQWNSHPALRLSEVDAMNYVQRHAILNAKSEYYVLKPNGKYDTTPTDKIHLIAKIRALGMDEIVPTWSMSINGGMSDQSVQGMLNKFVSDGYEVDGIVDERDGIVEGKKILKTLFRREPIEPRYDERVDQWLKIFAAGEYRRLCEWIGLALAWDEGPICALSIRSSPGSGKKLLIQGLVECISTHEFSTVQEFGGFQSGILRSPLLWVNEGFTETRNMPMSPSDTFRAFVSGDPIRVRELYRAPITVHNPLRIIFTTNNDDIIRTLAGGRDLTENDRDAIAIRLYHIDVSANATRWLDAQGGREFTRGWIRGDSGQESDLIVAGHFMWLYQNRPKKLTGRFLMEGCNNERLIKAMTLRSGAAPAVFEVLTRIIELHKQARWGAVVEPGGLIFVTENLLEEYDREYNKGRKPLNAHVIRNVLAAMRYPGTEPVTCVKGTGDRRKVAAWHQLNGRLILDEAIERGLPCGQLQRILDTGNPNAGQVWDQTMEPIRKA